MSATNQLDFEFLPLRAKLLDLAATFDRLDRGSESLDDDPRMAKIRRCARDSRAAGLRPRGANSIDNESGLRRGLVDEVWIDSVA